MNITLRDLLLANGWKSAWFNDTGDTARIGSRPGGSAFVPFKLRHRLFAKKRFCSIRELLGRQGTRIAFSSALRTHYGFLGMIEGCTSYEQMASEFPWDNFLIVSFPGHPRSMFSSDNYDIHVLDEETGKEWKMWMPVLTWVRLVSIEVPNGTSAT